MDKSKADWIVKIIAMIQIARLIFDLITRGISVQPVTQLEITTASFSIFAIVTYLVNWWKPKDIKQPTKIHAIIDQGGSEDLVELKTEPFFERLWSPTPPDLYYADTVSPSIRVRNDELWIGKRQPKTTLAWLTMALSCVVFWRNPLRCLVIPVSHAGGATDLAHRCLGFNGFTTYCIGWRVRHCRV